MSAEFFYASCPLPINSDGNLASKEEAMPVLLERIDAMDEATLFEVADIYCGGMATDEETIEAVKGALASLFDESAECVDVVKSGRWVRESGGMSWGDSPTEAFDDLNLLASARITREPIDGGFFVPNPLRAAIQAYTKFLGLKLDEVALKQATAAFGSAPVVP